MVLDRGPYVPADRDAYGDLLELAENPRLQLLALLGMLFGIWLFLGLIQSHYSWLTWVEGGLLLAIPVAFLCVMVALVAYVVTLPIGVLYGWRVRSIAWPWLTIFIIATFCGVLLYRILTTPYRNLAGMYPF